MADFFFRTSPKSFKGIDGKWHDTNNATCTWDNSTVIFSPNNGQAPLTITPASKSIDIDGDATKAAIGYFTTDSLVSTLQAVFPKGNAGSVSPGGNSVFSTNVEITDISNGYILPDANGSGHKLIMKFYLQPNGDCTAEVTQYS